MVAEEFQTVQEGLFFWQAWSPAVKTELSCCAHLWKGRLVFIDPIPLAEPALSELLALTQGASSAILLTNGNHGRAAPQWRQRLQAPILAHEEAISEFDFSVDHPLADGSAPFEGWSVQSLDGAAPGEIALCAGGVVHCGDALIHIEPPGFGLLPKKYCRDAAALRTSLGKLLRWEFEVLTFAHGLPLAVRARQRLAALLA